MELVDKVLAYITRESEGHRQLLVFDHRNAPDAGTQVPAGTVEPDEPIENALWREVAEESGLGSGQLRLVGKLTVYESEIWHTRRHVFHLAAETAIPESWAQTVAGGGEDAGLVFDYRWINLEPGIELAGNQHAFLGLIR
jgi:ADP-ribose pyrophosphatase YjhB (NUDIX family)